MKKLPRWLQSFLKGAVVGIVLLPLSPIIITVVMFFLTTVGNIQINNDWFFRCADIACSLRMSAPSILSWICLFAMPSMLFALIFQDERRKPEEKSPY